MSYERRFAYFNPPTNNMTRVQTEHHTLVIMNKGVSPSLMLNQEEAVLLIPLLQYFAEHGNIPSKEKIDDMQLYGVNGHRQ